MQFGREGFEMEKRELIFESAREIFAVKGYKGASISDIAQKAGLAVGTFYIYFESKDRLFVEIFKQETEKLMKQIMSSLDVGEEPMKLIRRLLEENMKGMLANPILRQWYQPEIFAKIEKICNEDNVLGSMEFLYRDFHRLVQMWQADGRMRSDISSEMIMAIFGAIIRIGYHKEEIGLKYFPELQDRLTEFVLEGLSVKDR